MTALPVEWVLVVFYGLSAHKSTYGRLSDKTFTKDYIQLSRKPDFKADLGRLFSLTTTATGSISLTYKWPGGSAPGELILHSSDRPHLSWETKLGSPPPWRMSLTPSDTKAETIPGDPNHVIPANAEAEFNALGSRGAGQPYLLAIKLINEPRVLHLRAYLKGPNPAFAWADLGLLPKDIQALAAKTSKNSALASSFFASRGVFPSSSVTTALATITASKDFQAAIQTFDYDTCRQLQVYLADPAQGMFFDVSKNHNAWSVPPLLPTRVTSNEKEISGALQNRITSLLGGDAIAESLEVSAKELDEFREQIKKKSYEVADSFVTAKTRGSAQRAFAEVVKENYGMKCAITGIGTKDFLIAAHIVPWSQDQSIRLDPSNGICLSLLMDRAFENGFILVKDDLTIVVNSKKIGADKTLLDLLKPYDGKKLRSPVRDIPDARFLARRRAQLDTL